MFDDYTQARLNRLDRKSDAAHGALGALDWLTENLDRCSGEQLEKHLKRIRDNLAEELAEAGR